MMDCPEPLSCDVTAFAFLISANFVEVEVAVEMRVMHTRQGEKNYVNLK
jgi:hypothetical protein